ncbi:MAG: folate-binding protein [Pseudomonadota bacterium]
MQSRFAFLPHRVVLSLKGPDTIALLERLITCTTSGWSLGEARFGALLTPQGKIIADFLAVRTEDGVLLDVHRDAREGLAKRLKLFRLRADVAIESVDGAIVVAGIEPATHGVRPVSGAQLVYVDPRYEGGRLRAIAAEAEWRQYHGHEAEWSLPPDEHEADRISSRVPEWGLDYGAAEVFPADVNADRLGGVDYSKGCFVGQEVVSRMFRRGKIRKRTMVVEGDGLEPGAAIESKGPIGEVTSVCGGVGLARVRLDRLAKARASDTKLLSNGQAVSVKSDREDWLNEEIMALQVDE